MSWCFLLVFVFFFKQKTAYEMRISDWSSDVCSSDLSPYGLTLAALLACGTGAAILILSRRAGRDRQVPGRIAAIPHYQIGRASCRERVCQYVSIPVVAVSLKKNQNTSYPTLVPIDRTTVL